MKFEPDWSFEPLLSLVDPTRSLTAFAEEPLRIVQSVLDSGQADFRASRPGTPVWSFQV
jgi:hypothetical protein